MFDSKIVLFVTQLWFNDFVQLGIEETFKAEAEFTKTCNRSVVFDHEFALFFVYWLFINIFPFVGEVARDNNISDKIYKVF